MAGRSPSSCEAALPENTVRNDAGARAGVTGKSTFWSGDDDDTLEHKNKLDHHPKVITPDKLPAFLKAPQ